MMIEQIWLERTLLNLHHHPQHPQFLKPALPLYLLLSAQLIKRGARLPDLTGNFNTFFVQGRMEAGLGRWLCFAEGVLVDG